MPDKTADSVRKEIAEGGYNGYIPPAAFNALEWEAAGIKHGTATLVLHIRDGKLARFSTARENSFISE